MVPYNNICIITIFNKLQFINIVQEEQICVIDKHIPVGIRFCCHFYETIMEDENDLIPKVLFPIIYLQPKPEYLINESLYGNNLTFKTK